MLISSGSKSNTGCLPPNYRHIRTSVKSVRPEYYTAIDCCISELHMSKEQSIGSTIIFAKELFNLRWKTSEEDDCVVDLDSVPDKSNQKDGKCQRGTGFGQPCGEDNEQ